MHFISQVYKLVSVHEHEKYLFFFIKNMTDFLHSPVRQKTAVRYSMMPLQSMVTFQYSHTKHDKNSLMHNILQANQAAKRKIHAKSGVFT